MNRKQKLLAAMAMVVSLSAHAQLVSVDHGAAAIDGNGLMWANVVGTNLTYYPMGGAGTAESWITDLNAANYGGFHDWTFATGDGSFAANTTTNQLGELFYNDCGNSLGIQTVMNNARKNCGALSAVQTAVATGMGGFPGDALFVANSGIGEIRQGYPAAFWAYFTPNSGQGYWDGDTDFNGIVGQGYALAVRTVAAPEIDPASLGSGLALLIGGLAVLKGRRGV